MICSHCNNAFEPKNNKQKYCSSKCYKIAKARRYYKRYTTKRLFTIICVVCGKQHLSWRRNGKFCSKLCQGAAKKKYLNIPQCLVESERKIDKNIGYVRIYCPMHPEANTWGYVYEHRIVAESIIGRRLEKFEVVHHRNGKRWDNRPENLEIMNKVDHAKLFGQRPEDIYI